MHVEPDNDHIPGTWFGALSLRPALEVAAFIKLCDDYTKERRAKAGSAVFKAHPGIRSVFVTDMAGLDFIFDAPPEELDRLADDDPGFGGLSFNRHEMLEGVIPALLTHAGNHDPARAIVVEAMQIRRQAFAPACQKVFDYGLPMLRDATGEAPVNFKHALHHAAIGICFEWLFDIDPGPSGANAETWLKGCFGLKADTALANAVARRLSRAKNGPKAAIRRYAGETLNAIRSCPPYPKFVEAAHRIGVPEKDLAGHLMFAASFNGTAGAWATLFPALSHLYVDKQVRGRLAAELEAFSGDVFALNKLPYMHDFFLESMRLYGRPRHYYRRAKVDLVIPVSIGDPVPVKAGTTLGLIATVARQDRTVWGDDASVFDPDRYARNPALRDRVKPFGPPVDARNAYGCAGAASGVSATLWKTLAGAVGRTQTWRLTPWPEPDVDAFDGVRPSELNWSR